MSLTVGLGSAATTLLSSKWEQPYCSTMAWISCSLSFSLLRSSIQCIRGACSAAGCASKQLIPPIDLVSTEANFFFFFFRTLCCLVPSVLVEPVYYVAPTYCNYYYKNNAFMAVMFAFVSADTNAIPADTNAIQRMLGYPHAPMKSVAFTIVIASSGRISFPLHAWPPGSRLCQLTQTRYQLTQT